MRSVTIIYRAKPLKRPKITWNSSGSRLITSHEWLRRPTWISGGTWLNLTSEPFLFIKNNTRKFILRTYFSYLVQLVLFYCFINLRIRSLLSKNIVPVHSKLLTRTWQKILRSRSGNAHVCTSRNSANWVPTVHAASRTKLLPTFYLKTEGSMPSQAVSTAVELYRSRSAASHSARVCPLLFSRHTAA